ncbi:MAG: haloacid dehalogenase-like hydrolase [Bacteroidales bacterium]|nr:haloacid dehalogenase-like hydrolase [Bacteroidales bacterium]
MKRKKTIIALIYDFDGTLSTANMQEFGFIQAIGKSPSEFWSMCNNIADGQEMNHVLAYMKCMLDEAKKCDIPLTKDSLVGFGRDVELYNGVREWFALINEYGKKKGVIIEHYINSSGITEIIDGTPIAREFKKIFACSFLYDASGIASWPAVAVDYTAKTQFLFKITKGILDITDSKLVNDSRKDEDKPIPFPNMIYFGDGQTDVPCMKIVKMFGGNAIAVYQKQNEKMSRTARELLKQDRVNFICNADYSADGEIYKVVCTIIDKIAAENEYDRLRRSNSKR